MVVKSFLLMDDIVGEVMAALAPEDTLIVLSDHGFSTWRRSFHINTWLAREGYIGLSGGSGQVENLENLFDRGEFWPNVDWRRTRAYHLGLGGLYINLAGREAQGGIQAEIMVKMVFLAVPAVDEAVPQVAEREGMAPRQGELHPDAGVEEVHEVGHFMAVGLIDIGAVKGIVFQKRGKAHRPQAVQPPARGGDLQGRSEGGHNPPQGAHFQGGGREAGPLREDDFRLRLLGFFRGFFGRWYFFHLFRAKGRFLG